MKVVCSFKTFSETAHFSLSSTESWIILTGSGTLRIGRDSEEVLAKDYLRIPPETEVSVFPERDITVGCLRLDDFVTTQNHFRKIRSPHVDRLIELFLYAKKIDEEDFINKASVRSALSQLLWEMMLSVSLDKDHHSGSVDALVADIMAHYLDSEYTMAEMIESTGYSASHFRKIFRQETGLSPHEFLSIKRLEYAKKLMWQERGRLSISEFAYRSGFSDPGNFSKYFTKIQGESPKAYLEGIKKTCDSSASQAQKPNS